MDHAGGNSSDGGGASESNWPQSLDKPLTQEVYDFGLLVPPGCRLAKPWRICKDGYPTLDNTATSEQLRVHPGGRHAYWDGKNYNDVIRRYRKATTAAAREEAKIAAAIQATAAAATVGANPPPIGDDDDVDWDTLANSSDDDGAVDGPAVVYLDSD
ncbi:hypothetical protein D1007_44693 [Hordeum vulgare]|nr:hypothetical protein D1007_44693 [Hordeum vulgare]